jgi:hypothetical protein
LSFALPTPLIPRYIKGVSLLLVPAMFKIRGTSLKLCQFVLYAFQCGLCITYSFFRFVLFTCRLLPLYFPRDKHEEEVALTKLPADVGDENGETTIDERKIRIKPLPKKKVPKPPREPVDLPVSDVGLVRRSVNF